MRRWSSIYRFAWTPIITFGVRRLGLLEWIEEHLEPVSFSEGVDHVGVALMQPHIRVTVTGRGMTLEDGVGSDAGVRPLMDAVGGVLDVLRPRAVTFQSSTVAWSHSIESVDYDRSRAAFAQNISRTALTRDGLAPFDGSALMDLHGDLCDAQVEWGLVSATELLERVSRPGISRVGAQRGGADLIGVDRSDLPEASVFADVAVMGYRPTPNLEAVKGIYDLIDSVDNVSKNIATAVHEGVAQREGDQEA